MIFYSVPYFLHTKEVEDFEEHLPQLVMNLKEKHKSDEYDRYSNSQNRCRDFPMSSLAETDSLSEFLTHLQNIPTVQMCVLLFLCSFSSSHDRVNVGAFWQFSLLVLALHDLDYGVVKGFPYIGFLGPNIFPFPILAAESLAECSLVRADFGVPLPAFPANEAT